MGQAPAEEVVGCRGAGGADGGCSTRHVLRWAGSSTTPPCFLGRRTSLQSHVLRTKALLWLHLLTHGLTPFNSCQPVCMHLNGGGVAACMWSGVLHTFTNTGKCFSAVRLPVCHTAQCLLCSGLRHTLHSSSCSLQGWAMLSLTHAITAGCVAGPGQGARTAFEDSHQLMLALKQHWPDTAAVAEQFEARPPACLRTHTYLHVAPVDTLTPF